MKWRNRKGDAKNHGKINLARLFSPTDDVVVYGYAEIESGDGPRRRVCCSAATTRLTVWVNGKKVLEFDGNRGWNYDANKVKIHLEKGKNKLLIKCGNTSGPWDFSVAVTGDAGQVRLPQGRRAEVRPGDLPRLRPQEPPATRSAARSSSAT